MGDESGMTALKVVQMGADNNSNATSKLATLQTRKQSLEERILVKNKELRQLCIQEAELTGVMPPEFPLEPGEIPPTFRRRVGTAYEYPQNVVNSLSNENEIVPALETDIQIQKKIAEAALQLAHSNTISRSIRRKNLSLYRHTTQHLNFLEEKLKNIKLQGAPDTSTNSQAQQLKLKKKPRPNAELDTISTKSSNPSQGDEISVNRNFIQPLLQREHNRIPDRYSLGNKYSTNFSNSNSYIQTDVELHNPDNQNVTDNFIGPSFNKFLVNSYISNNIRNEETNSNMQTSYAYSNPNVYQHQQVHIPNSQTLPHSPNHYQRHSVQNHGNFSNHPHTLTYTTSRVRHYSEESTRKYSNEAFRASYNQDAYPYYTPPSSHSFGPHLSPQNFHKQVGHGFPEPNHQILSHQQYQVESMSSAGLGGHWVKTENGEMIWQQEDVSNSWHSDKRFGSLDRRKAKHIRNKRTSPNLEMINKQPVILRSATNVPENSRPLTLQSVPSKIRTEKADNRQLVRTQSLGSVGAHTVDSVWPSDDNSSYDSDVISLNDNNNATKKLKQKGWCETSLDAPAVSQSGIQEESFDQYPSPIPISSPTTLLPSALPVRTPRPVLEIPAESNPSPKHIETNMEMFNTNVLTDLPKNCTIVQAGQYKPYREVTKPFEMADFYKYSTKIREKNQEKLINKLENDNKNQDGNFSNSPRIEYDNCQGQEDLYQKGIYQPLQPMKCQPLNATKSYSNVNSPCAENVNSSLDNSLRLNESSMHVAEHFSAEMNAWYQTHNHNEPRVDNNNSSTSPLRTTATLV